MPKITEGQFALGGLALFAVWVFVVLPFLYPCPEAVYSNQRPANAQNEADYVGNQPPSFIALKFFTTAGRDEITRYCTQKANKEEQEWAQKYVCDIKITDVYLAVFNGALAFLTAGLIAIGYFTIRKMRITEERQLRAYVFPTEARLTKFSAGHAIECRIAIENSGQTPAYRLTHMAMIGLVEFPPKEPHPECKSSETISRTNIGPGGKIVKIGDTKWSLTDVGVEMLNSGTAAIYVFGRIDFTDAFGHARWVEYRYMSGGDFGFHSDGGLFICLEGNETSEG